jgi:hypothetical protein
MLINMALIGFRYSGKIKLNEHESNRKNLATEVLLNL